MIEAYKVQKEGVIKGSLNDLGNTRMCWANCINPTAKELKDISEKAKIPLSDLQEVLDEEERPKVSDLEKYSLIIIRAPLTEKDEILTTPLSIFISNDKNNVITIALKEIRSIQKIRDLITSKKIDVYEKGISFFTYRLLDEVLNTYFSILDTLEEKIDLIEDKVVEKPDKISAKNIFLIKKTLIYFHKSLTANREVITSIEKEYVINIDKKNIKRFRTLYNDVTQLIDTEGTYREILTGTLDVYLSAVSNNLNQVMKTLTIGASFILIPTLIASIYGMNFNTASPYNMPELLWNYGYLFALGLMVFSIVITYLFFKRKGWL
ncbi:magnesium/cobalt transporter CorA [Candidatus Woesearchaeota archaeon]|nr:magnesium/cobalt transporter CorA [Candidatus Woesearchaeota archaeon]